ncbi:large ribosomal subunit protein mL38 isoform X1 [Lepisosteus oculatus]|uniref:large ribosomal subunit protein mL38 isoform X1 n=2 Tax=Lepisosteus oculatus TaxID=7918 RepID=UPI00371FEF46
MAARMVCGVVLRTGTDLGVFRRFGTSAAACRRAAPLGPMPNEDIDARNLESLEKYRSYTRYLKVAEEESRKPHWWKTYRQYVVQEEGAEKIDIGLPRLQLSRSQEVKERRKLCRENRRSSELERATRLQTLRIPLDEVKAEWERTNGPYDVQRVAEYYGIYRDLFPHATFVPRVVLRVVYGTEGEHSSPVHCGNVLTPSEAASAPHVTFGAEDGSLWTLLLTSPDEHLRDNESEYVHWLVGNIPGNMVHSGEEVCHYFPPFPAKGTGFHRFVFILFKQEGPINFKEDYRQSPCHSLTMRTFRTLDFYRKHQDAMTPAGLAFFQCQWDDSVTHTFHEMLSMKEPVFEYDRPPVYHPPQKKYPHGQPLRYLDRYRDSQEPSYGIY